MCNNCGCSEGNGCNCGCCDTGNGKHFNRQYQTKSEQITELESYLSELKSEVQAVEEHLADLRR